MCVAPMSIVPSGLRDQKITASPGLGLTASVRRAHAENDGPLSPFGAWGRAGRTVIGGQARAQCSPADRKPQEEAYRRKVWAGLRRRRRRRAGTFGKQVSPPSLGALRNMRQVAARSPPSSGVVRRLSKKASIWAREPRAAEGRERGGSEDQRWWLIRLDGMQCRRELQGPGTGKKSCRSNNQVVGGGGGDRYEWGYGAAAHRRTSRSDRSAAPAGRELRQLRAPLSLGCETLRAMTNNEE